MVAGGTIAVGGGSRVSVAVGADIDRAADTRCSGDRVVHSVGRMCAGQTGGEEPEKASPGIAARGARCVVTIVGALAATATGSLESATVMGARVASVAHRAAGEECPWRENPTAKTLLSFRHRADDDVYVHTVRLLKM